MTNRSPIITILLVAYNHENTIAASLDSVLGQKTKYPYTIWLAEDCSTDGTLKICKEYAKKYPTKIKLFAQKTNTKGEHFSKLLSTVKTKYLTHLDGDDRWTDTKKLQIAINTLERNPKYITFAHDTLYNDMSDGTKKSLVHEVHGINLKNPVDIYSAPYLHASARIHRNVPGSGQHFKKLLHAGDIYMYYYFLDRGPLYYYDKIMSVYNINGKGSWSKLSAQMQAANIELAYYTVNRMLGYRHDTFFTQKAKDAKLLGRLKKVLGVRLGWRAYILLIRRQIVELK